MIKKWFNKVHGKHSNLGGRERVPTLIPYENFSLSLTMHAPHVDMIWKL